MIRSFRQAAGPKDLHSLVPAGDSLGRNLLRGALPVSVVVFGVVYLVSRSPWLAGGVAAVVFAASLKSNVSFFRDVNRRKGSADPEAVEVIEVEASRVFDIEPLGSHGPAYVFFSDDGRALLLIGQWLLQRRKFPTQSFRLHRWADTGEPIRIMPSGGKIKPEQSNVRVPSSPRVPDIAIITAAAETLQDDLDRAFR